MNRLIAPHHVVSLCDEMPQTVIDLGLAQLSNYLVILIVGRYEYERDVEYSRPDG